MDAAEKQPANANAQPGYKKLNLYTGSFAESRYGSHSSFRNNSIALMQGGPYINGMFLSDKGKMIQPPAPGFLLIMHNDIVGHAARSLLTAVDTRGQTIWQCTTGISSKINNCITAKGYCILVGNKDAIAGPHIGSNMLCVVDMKDGKMVMAALEL
jgi:hypothetical protein